MRKLYWWWGGYLKDSEQNAIDKPINNNTSNSSNMSALQAEVTRTSMI